MAFFDKLVGSVSEAGSSIQKKAKNYTSSRQIDAELHASKKACETLLRRLGEEFYKARTEGLPDSALDGLVSQIDALKKKIDTLSSQKAKSRGIRICPACAHKIDSESRFCQFCGAKLEPIPDYKRTEAEAAGDDEIFEEEDVKISFESPDSEDPDEPLDAEFVPFGDLDSETMPLPEDDLDQAEDDLEPLDSGIWQAAAEPEPAAAEPEPAAVEPEPAAAEPEPAAVEPEPAADEPEPAQP